MNPPSYPLLRDLVLIGGGHAHALFLRMWGMAPLAGTRLTLVNPRPVAPYTGMLPGYVAGHFARQDLMIDLVRLARFAGARLILDRAVGLDLGTRHIQLDGRRPLRFDVASLDIGVGSQLPAVPGFGQHAVSARPLDACAAAWEAFMARRLAYPRLVIIGAGLGGVELSLASAFRLRAAGARPDITVIDRAEVALQGVGSGARTRLLAELAAQGIKLVLGAEPERISADAVHLTSGVVLPSDFTLSVAGAQPQGWLARSGLSLESGFVAVGPTLQSSDPGIFAAGDCAHLTQSPRPKAGVYAVRQAPVLHHNLRIAMQGNGRMKAFKPQGDYLKLISIGRKTAVADKLGLRAGGAWLWRVKDRIDRAFMARLRDLPAMPRPALPAEATAGLAEALDARPLCGGCGAKVGAGILGPVLKSVLTRGLPFDGVPGAAPVIRRGDVLSGPGDDAAILQHGAGLQVMTTDHLRRFTEDASVMARITALHALGDIWAMGAAPQVALAQITLPRLGPVLQADMLAEILHEAASVFAKAGAEVVGGHSSIGDELTIGFTVTGLAARAVAKGGARPGDALILTKPLGSGTILAAEMAMAQVPGLLMGEIWVSCLDIMQRSSGPASAALMPHAHAMTDVTGFGLAGHLLEMMEASGTAARVRVADLPLMPGAAALAQAGHASSLAPANRAAVIGRLTGPDTPLIHDPQTAGGLLASVPAAQVPQCMTALQAAGCVGVVIGQVTEGPAHLTLL